MHKAFFRHVPSVGGGDRLVEVVGVGAIIDEGVGGCGLFVHLPKDLDGGGSWRHGVRLFVRDVRVVAIIVKIRGDTPTRVTEGGIVGAGMNGGTIGE